MQLEIDKDSITQAIQDFLAKTVRDGVDYKVKEKINQAVGDAITPELAQQLAGAAFAALSAPETLQGIAEEMKRAMIEGLRITMQEAVISMVCKLQRIDPYKPSAQEAVDAIRARLFPGS